ncbi:hypothetical protein [Cohaesibacter sp. ES.047]|uniref:hypothetical protein n=1 Tax=Cohaesibacter sp. ES.047 TaxID=1798205 RepID=UPI000BB969C5|nr:hypothetical protein [Cohaesibacter sp. ES.047]
MTIVLIKTRSLGLLCISQIAVLSLWFSASAVAPTLARKFSLTGEVIAGVYPVGMKIATS